MTHSHVKIKIQRIRKQLSAIKKSKDKYHKLFINQKHNDLIFRVFLSVVGAILLCSIILNYLKEDWAMLTSLVLSSVSTVSSAVYHAIDYTSKIQSSQTSWLQLLDLYNTYHNKLLKNNLTSEQYDHLLDEINVKIGLIYDSSHPMNDSNESVSERMYKMSYAEIPNRQKIKMPPKVSDIQITIDESKLEPI